VLTALGSSAFAGYSGFIDLSGGNCLTGQQGGQILSEGVFGKGLSLAPGDYLQFNGANVINPSGGTISFWVRPHWPSSDTRSHTFASFTWNDGRNGYFVISRGWWEPAGSPFTYFIFNNMDYWETSDQILFNPGGWTLLTCVWQTGAPGFIRFYVNGFKVAENATVTSAGYNPPQNVYIGTDQGSSLSAGRTADCDISALGFFSRALADNEILSMYFTQTPFTAPLQVDTDGVLVEKRAIFDEGTGWTDPMVAASTIQRIKAAGFNIYVPCIWHGMGARYPTSVAPQEPNLSFTGDPLANLIQIAHANGIQVHPWFTVVLRQLDFLQDYYAPQTPANAFDVHRPGFRDFTTALIADVAQRYDVDGINLDYMRSMGICQCDFCKSQYSQVMGRDLSRDIAQSTPGGPLEPHLQQWEDLDVQAIVAGVRNSLKGLKPSLYLSIDGHPVPGLNPEGREESAWSNAGLVDIVFDMDYGNPPNFENYNLMQPQFLDPRKVISLLADYVSAGTALSSQDPVILSGLVDYVRQRWGNGVGIYLYTMLSDDQIAQLAKDSFQANARPFHMIPSPKQPLLVQ
jgi:uncharacterized lipoprotein YddW (UPF0748 family)